jgi:penicillin-binding protein 1A
MPGDITHYLEAVAAWFRRHARGFILAGLGLAVLAGIGAVALNIFPRVVNSFAPRLDLSKDLYAINRPPSFTFLDANGHDIGHRGAQVGHRLSLDEMPAYLPAAFIATEDRRFYEHHGYDTRGLIRAAWVNWRAGHVVEGGSTITQQLAKILFLSPHRTYSRKWHEILDAAALEKKLSKRQILEVYLNRIYLGAGAFGVDGAAHAYFGKSAKHVTIAEAAMLASLTRAPTAFSPRRDLEAAQERASHVLQAMVETHAITQAQADDAREHPAEIMDGNIAAARNYFLDTAAEEAMRDVGAKDTAPNSDLIVHTTLEPKLEDKARETVVQQLAMKGKRLHAGEAAVVVMKLDGAVSALIGGRDYEESVFNRATQAHRQPGSAFKPFVYLAAVENGISPWDTREDGPVDIDGWQPTNYGGRSYGTVTLATALAHSINTVTAGLAQEVGLAKVIDAAKRCGINSPLAENASLALGTSEVTPLELTSAYATIANDGQRVKPYFISEVDDGAGHIIYKHPAPATDQAVGEQPVKDLTAMLYGVVQEGTGRAAALPDREVAGKTGTTQDYHDAWFVGFTTDYVTGVWVGNDDSAPMRNVTGGSLPAAIWKIVMTKAEDGLPAKPLNRSPPQAPDEDADSAYANGNTAPGYDRNEDGGDHPAFLDWLFGRPQASDADRNNSGNRDDENDRSGQNSEHNAETEGTLDEAPPTREYSPPADDESGN